jgi:hypothetical protein
MYFFLSIPNFLKILFLHSRTPERHPNGAPSEAQTIESHGKHSGLTRFRGATAPETVIRLEDLQSLERKG